MACPLTRVAGLGQGRRSREGSHRADATTSNTMRKRSFYRESRCSDHPGTGQSAPQTGRSRNARRDRLRGPLSPRRERRDDHHSRRTRSARHGNRPRACDGGHTVPRGRAAVQRQLRRFDHRRRGWGRHLAGPGRDPLARGRDPRLLGAVLLCPRPRRWHGLVGRPPAALPDRRRIRFRVPRRPGRVPPPRRRRSRPAWPSASRRTTTRKSAWSRSSTTGIGPASST